jgi:hypothetical protein
VAATLILKRGSAWSGGVSAMMKWMIVIMIFGTQPVKTALMFDTLQECSGIVDVIRKQQADAYNAALAWAKKQDVVGDLKRFETDRTRVLGLANTPTCIPHRP